MGPGADTAAAAPRGVCRRLDDLLELAVSVRHTQQDGPAEPEHRRTSTTVILHLGPPCSVS